MKKGVSDLATRNSVIMDLESRGLIPVTVDEIRTRDAVTRLTSLLLGTVSHVDKVLFTKHLSVMLRAGLSLLESLNILEEQANTWRMRVVIRHLTKKVQRGERFSDALADYPQVYSAFYVNIVRAGEVSGTLEENLDHLAVQFTKEYELRKKVQNAAMYPTVVLVAALLIGFFFATYVLPQVAALFAGLKGVKLPLVTVILLNVSDFTRRYTFLSFFGLIGGIVFVFWFLRRKFLRPATHWFILHAPILNKIAKDINLARFSLVFGTLLKSGIDITRAIQVTQSVLGNIYYKKAMDQILINVQRGIPLSESLGKYPDIFPKIVSRMIGVGERSGKLEETLRYLSDFYELEVESTMKNLATILEPVLLLFIGGIALGMAFAILIPIYNFIAAIKRI
jgi:type IV pilus assembly protein PilC